MKCECEHAEHAEHENGCQNMNTNLVSTEYGLFYCCEECANGHWKDVIRK